MFTDIRDHLLLGNRAGQSITDAYYAYTLFPAEAFKSLESETNPHLCARQPRWTVPTGTGSNGPSAPMTTCPSRPAIRPTLTIGQDTDKTHFSLENDQQLVLRVSAAELFGSPDKVLTAYSNQLDRNRMFRTLTLACLLLGFPLVLFTFLFSVLGMLPNLFITVAVSDMVTAIVCIVVGGHPAGARLPGTNRHHCPRRSVQWPSPPLRRPSASPHSGKPAKTSGTSPWM